MTDFLLELLSEEIPARMQARARNDLARMFAEALASAGLSHGAIETFSTPRRLALIARGVAEHTEAVSEELKGPRTSAPPQALEGFLRKTGLSQDQLEDRDGVWFAKIDRPGRGASDVIAEAVMKIIDDFPWPKSMRWGSGELRWVRPLHSIIALLGEEIVPIRVGDTESGATTLGHRFHHPGPITIGGANDYAEKLRACHVIVDQDEREAIIREGAAAAARAEGLELIEDEGLVVENAGLTEWPVPLLGRFDPDFLDVPREVIVLTMRTNQKYFACAGADGALAPAFLCTANIDATDGGEAIVEGNRRVLAARLSDARFFWEQDLKTSLWQASRKLRNVRYHAALGSYFDKTQRNGLMLIALSGRGEGLSNRAWAARIARLAKADLQTATVGEFPDVQGIIGGKIAEIQYTDPELSYVIGMQYSPAGNVGAVPELETAILHNIADNLDDITAFFAVGLRPSGSKDPFALRRSALTLIRLISESGLRLNLQKVIAVNLTVLGMVSLARALRRIREEFDLSVENAGEELHFDDDECTIKFHGQVFPLQEDIATQLRLSHIVRRRSESISRDVIQFIVDRLKVQQREAGVRHDLIDAVFALGGEDDLVRLLARVKALQGFVETGEGTNLLAAYKRAANILKKEEGSWTPDQVRGDDVPSEEQALVAALDAAEPTASTAIEAEDFTAAMAALASLRAPIDAFFDKVTVNADDPGTRARRLALLARFRDAVNRVADFSKIEG